jgi:type VI protein secretion system component VasK
VEVGLGILLLALFLALYWVPAGTNWAYRPHWWVWPVLGILFFGLLLVDARRRRRRRNEEMEELHEDLEEQRREPEP